MFLFPSQLMLMSKWFKNYLHTTEVIYNYKPASLKWNVKHKWTHNTRATGKCVMSPTTHTQTRTHTPSLYAQTTSQRNWVWHTSGASVAKRWELLELNSLRLAWECRLWQSRHKQKVRFFDFFKWRNPWETVSNECVSNTHCAKKQWGYCLNEKEGRLEGAAERKKEDREACDQIKMDFVLPFTHF